ncbi:MAG: acetyl-CoA carboxylase, carboxyltransferase subunit beta [Eubacteriaceae bacterium]|nr:acetyl-CoA carboxylase, carboxyltransferase subunit beta [Eubacteriaceae bacterium]
MQESNVFIQRQRRIAELSEKAKSYAGGALPKEDECPNCGIALKDLEDEMHSCHKCGFHLPISASKRLEMVFDGSYEQLFEKISAVNPISFPGYEQKLESVKSKAGINEACLAAVGYIGAIKAVCAVLDSGFLMGSMGTAVGEKITLSVEYAERHMLPLIIFSASGGARMQEGIFSLMQMAKTASAIKQFSDKGGFYISYLTHPTTGGVTASFASLGDIILAEPGALIGFAGPRVIEQTIKAALPEGFQRSEFLLEHGFIDAIIDRKSMKATLAQLLSLHQGRPGL